MRAEFDQTWTDFDQIWSDHCQLGSNFSRNWTSFGDLPEPDPHWAASGKIWTDVDRIWADPRQICTEFDQTFGVVDQLRPIIFKLDFAFFQPDFDEPRADCGQARTDIDSGWARFH